MPAHLNYLQFKFTQKTEGKTHEKKKIYNFRSFDLRQQRADFARLFFLLQEIYR